MCVVLGWYYKIEHSASVREHFFVGLMTGIGVSKVPHHTFFSCIGMQMSLNVITDNWDRAGRNWDGGRIFHRAGGVR